MRAFLLAGAASLAFATSAMPAFAAAYTNVDLSSYVNGNLLIHPSSYPTGLSTGNQATGIPFNVSTFNSTNAGAWFAKGTSSPGTSSTLSVDLTSYNIFGQASFYALLNNYYGQSGVNEYNVVVHATNGDSVTYSSIGGVDTRDYNNNKVNNIAGTTTPWFNNGLGQRLDVRQFALPTSFATETLSSFQIVQLQSSDPAFLTGLTFSSAPAATFSVPEPMSLTVFGFGLAGLLAARRLGSSARPRG